MASTPADSTPSEGAVRGRKRKLAITIAKFAISAIAIVLVFRTVDFEAAFRRVGLQDGLLIFAAVVVMLSQIVLGALRWHVVRRGVGLAPSFANTFRIYWIGSFFSSYVISGVSGDIVRGFLSWRQGADVTRSVTSVVLDRILVLAGIAVMLLPAMPWFLTHFGSGLEGWAPAVASTGLFAGIVVATQAKRLPASVRGTLPGQLLTKLGDGLDALFLQPATAVRGIVAAILAQVALAVATWLLATSLHLNIGFIDCLIVIQIVAVVNAIPISVGGWGVREFAVVGLLGAIGVPAEPALILSVELGLIGLIVNLPGGPIWLLLPADQRSRKARQAMPVPQPNNGFADAVIDGKQGDGSRQEQARVMSDGDADNAARMSDPERYWNSAGEVSYAEKMYVSKDVEQHVRLGLWSVALDIARRLGVPDKGRVLDLGCGDGAFANHSLKNYGRVDGYDLAPAAIQRAQRDAPGEHYHYEAADLIAFDYDKLPKYDGVFLIGILHHVKQATPQIIAKLARVTDRVIVLEPNGDNLFRKALELTPSYRKAGEDSFRTEELKRLFADAGFDCVVSRRMNLFPNFTPGVIYRALAPLERLVEKSAFLRAMCTVNMMGYVRRAPGAAPSAAS